jgi:hypothetical protein
MAGALYTRRAAAGVLPARPQRRVSSVSLELDRSERTGVEAEAVARRSAPRRHRAQWENAALSVRIAEDEEVTIELPFAPGESPFRTKGNVYRSLFDSADARVPGGHRAVRDRIDDPHLAAFFDQTFLAASSYDVLPIVPFGMVAARLCGMTYPEFVRGGAAFTAKRDMNGVYRVLLKLASPEAVVKRLPRILLQYFDFGRIEGRFVGTHAYEAIARGLPQPLIAWIVNIAHGFLPVVMEAAGARDVDLQIGAREPDQEERGVLLYRSSFVVTWKE